MQELKFVRTEDGSLVVTDEIGELYKVMVDDAVLSGIRSVARGDHKSKASPREIQALIRAGKSAADVAALTGAELADVERFEVPVIDERNFILKKAHEVTVVTNPSDSHASATTFGEAMGSRLEGLAARDTEWFAWKDEHDGWLIGANFSSHDVAHHAVWQFDHKKSVLSPQNEDAKTLSQQGDVGDRLIPKLRAVETEPNRERFDSGAFQPVPMSDTPVITEVVEPLKPESTHSHPSSFNSSDEAAQLAQHIEERAVTREEEPVDFGQTADLLDALRRRRGERDSQPQPVLSAENSAQFQDTSASPEIPVSPITDKPDNDSESAQLDTQPLVDGNSEDDSDEHSSPKRGRPGMPSWDDILFGTRSDEDPF